MKKNKEKFRRAVVVVVEMELYERLAINEAALGGGDYITFPTPLMPPARRNLTTCHGSRAAAVLLLSTMFYIGNQFITYS